MECTEHERLERVHIQRREATRKVSPEENAEQFQRLSLEEWKALDDLKDHDAEHGCQRI
jgi:hypothetical protein